MSHRNGRQTPAPLVHRNRGDFDAFAEYFFRGIGDPRERNFGPPRFIGTPFPCPGYYYDHEDSYPPGSYERGDEAGGSQALKPFHEERQKEDAAEQGEGVLPFAKAMKKLHKEVTDAEAAYLDHWQAFNSDISNIDGYASTQLKVELWGRKWGGKKEEGDSDSEDASGESPIIFMDTHEKLWKKLTSSMTNATHSKGLGKKTIQGENAERLREKVETAQKQILDLLTKVPKHYDHCKSLLSELALLKALVAPEDEANKKLYKPGGGSDEGASNVDGQQQDRGGAGAGADGGGAGGGGGAQPW